ncbi:hypothetical protein FACS189468_5520 [Spirochaetia bacterium]|nr:hypothetical protein FACS189468_5520 [Spirochaetia bacterium]
MKRSKEEYEKLLNNSPLFTIEKDKEGELYAAEERRFLTDLAEYLSLYIFTQDTFAEIGLEIIETAKSCIKAFDARHGIFLHYFNYALSNRRRVSVGKKAAQERQHGLKVGDNALIRKVNGYARLKGYDLSDTSTIRHLCTDTVSLDVIAALCGVPAEDVIRTIRTIYETSVLGEFTVNDGGEEISIFDSFDVLNRVSTPETKLEMNDEVIGLLQSIDSTYKNSRDSQKPLLKKLINSKLIPALLDLELDPVTVPYTAFDFWDTDIEKQYRLTGTVPTARDIAAMFDVLEQSASRTINTFFKKVEAKC